MGRAARGDLAGAPWLSFVMARNEAKMETKEDGRIEGDQRNYTEIDGMKWQPIETCPEETPVWLYEKSRGIWVGTYEYDSDGWCFTNTYGSHYFHDGKWLTDTTDWDDDYQPTAWMPLPEPPQ